MSGVRVIQTAAGWYLPVDPAKRGASVPTHRVFPERQAAALTELAKILDGYRANPLEDVKIRALLDACADGDALDEALGGES